MAFDDDSAPKRGCVVLEGAPAAGGRSERDTLDYVGAMIVDLRRLAEAAGSERLATLLALAQHEVRVLLAGPARGDQGDRSDTSWLP